MIAKLRDFQIGQVIRQEGPQSHRVKAGTPTMGGLLILAAAIGPTLLWADLSNPYIWIAVLTTCAFGAVGFADDYLKMVQLSHHGLRPRYKVGLQVLIAIAVGLALMALAANGLYNTRLIFPFFKNLIPDLGWFYVAFTVLVLVGATNAVNLTDGLDGLAISTFGVAAAAFTALAYVTGHAVLADYLLLVRFARGRRVDGCSAARSSGPAWDSSGTTRIRPRSSWAMWDRWRSAARSAPSPFLIKQELLLPIVGGVFVIEALSVIVQVVSFKLRGRRVFKMRAAPSPSLRAEWMERAQGEHPILDPVGDLCAVQSDDTEAAVMLWITEPSPFGSVAW